MINLIISIQELCRPLGCKMESNLAELLHCLLVISALENELRGGALAALEPTHHARNSSNLIIAIDRAWLISGAAANNLQHRLQISENRKNLPWGENATYRLLKVAHETAGAILALLSTRCLHATKVPNNLERLRDFRRAQIAAGDSMMHIYNTSDFELYDKFLPTTRIICMHNDEPVAGLLTFSLADDLHRFS